MTQMDQFSHDLTLALEETSLMDRASGVGRWGSRRRTRSTGNLPCAPQPTEDSSSSPTDTANALNHNASHPSNNVDNLDMHGMGMPQSDSDDNEHAAPQLRLPCKSLNAIRLGALESDSLNETNFSPARFYKLNSRRKRKIKRYIDFDIKTNPNMNAMSLPQNSTGSPTHLGTTNNALHGVFGNNMSGGIGTTTGTVRKRFLKSDTSNRSNLFFCGKRKRSNRDRYHDHEHGAIATKAHSSSMPRHNYIEEHRMRPRSYSSTSKPHSDRLLPLNKGLLSKIERISQRQKTHDGVDDDDDDDGDGDGSRLNEMSTTPNANDHSDYMMQTNIDATTTETNIMAPMPATAAKKSCNIEAIVPVNDIETLLNSTKRTHKHQHQHHHHLQQFDDCELLGTQYQMHRKKSPHRSVGKSYHSRSRRMQQLQFSMVTDDMHHNHYYHQYQQQQQNDQQQSMDCSDLNDFLSSSSLSSTSDSEDDHRIGIGGLSVIRNDTDREGDDELTDWPGNEYGPGFKYDPKRKLTKKSTLPQIRSDETLGDDDTLMSGTESLSNALMGNAIPSIIGSTATTTSLLSAINNKCTASTTFEAINELYKFQHSEPIRINSTRNDAFQRHIIANMDDTSLDMDNDNIPQLKQIESEMSGETSNPFLSSSPVQPSEIREIRAGCRRIKGERPGFSIKLSANERLARFLQDQRQTQIRLPDLELYEHDSLLNLATLYSLNMSLDNGCAVLTKTSNTTQTVNIEHQGLPNHRSVFLSDFKRRCYDGNESIVPPK